MPLKKLKSKRPRLPDLAPSDLVAWQRTMHAALTRPLASGDSTQRTWFDGSSTARAVARLVKPSATLRPIERVEIYNRMYWFRLLDSLAQDFPGLRALLGEKKFWRLAESYLTANPSRSFTLRDLGSRLPRFLRAHPRLTAPHAEGALDLARFEWAQIIAFDGPSRPRLSRKALATADATTLRLALQPYLTVQAYRHPVDNYVLAIKRDGALRTEASNAVTERAEGGSASALLERCAPVDIVVHRVDNQLYYKRVDRESARLLRAIAKGLPLAEACAYAFKNSSASPEEQGERIRAECTLWMRLGWLCARV